MPVQSPTQGNRVTGIRKKELDAIEEEDKRKKQQEEDAILFEMENENEKEFSPSWMGNIPAETKATVWDLIGRTERNGFVHPPLQPGVGPKGEVIVEAFEGAGEYPGVDPQTAAAFSKIYNQYPNKHTAQSPDEYLSGKRGSVSSAASQLLSGNSERAIRSLQDPYMYNIKEDAKAPTVDRLTMAQAARTPYVAPPVVTEGGYGIMFDDAGGEDEVGIGAPVQSTSNTYVDSAPSGNLTSGTVAAKAA